MLSNVTLTYAQANFKVEDFWERGIDGQHSLGVGVVDDGLGDHIASNIEGGYACGEHTTWRVASSHAHMCAGIIGAMPTQPGNPVGVAPFTPIHSIRMYYPTYADRVNSIIEAIDYGIQQNLDALNISVHINNETRYSYSGDKITGQVRGTPKGLRLKLRDAFIRAYDADLIVFVAAGNRNTGGKFEIEDTELLPLMPGAISVGNLTHGNTRVLSSGVGRHLTLSGYGRNVMTTGLNNTFRFGTGTSAATPGIVGYFILYLETFRRLGYQLTRREVLNKMLDNCVKVDGLSDKEQGLGLPTPPSESYNLPILHDHEVLRMWGDLVWEPIEAFVKDSGEWEEIEVVTNG